MLHLRLIFKLFRWEGIRRTGQTPARTGEYARASLWRKLEREPGSFLKEKREEEVKEEMETPSLAEITQKDWIFPPLLQAPLPRWGKEDSSQGLEGWPGWRRWQAAALCLWQAACTVRWPWVDGCHPVDTSPSYPFREIPRRCIRAYIHPLIVSLSSLTAAYWQKSPLRTATYLATKPAPLGPKASTKSVSKTNGSISATQSRPLGFHLLRYSRAAVVNISVSTLCF